MLIDDDNWTQQVVTKYIENQIESNLVKQKLLLRINGQNEIQVVGKESHKSIRILVGTIEADEPFGIDVILSFDDEKSSYVIYITEIDNEICRTVLDDIVRIANAFYSGQFALRKRGFFFTSSKSIEFNDSNITHNVAVRTKLYG